MNKKLLAGLLTTATLGSLLVATNVDAAKSTEADNNEHMSTDAGIAFFDTNKPGPGPFENNLALAWAPVSFNFGNNDVTGIKGNVTYNQVIDASKKQYVAVSDDRTAEDKLKGWKLEAELDAFENVADETDTLAQAKLTFDLATPEKYNIDVKTSDKYGYAYPNVADDTSREAFDTTTAAYYKLTTPVSLTAADGLPQEVLSFNTDQSISNTLGVASQVSNVKLKVLDHTNVANKKYASTVHWRLSVTP